MSDRDALYRSILTHPGDNTPRLVYADWLEENGREEEAEFLRAGCKLESLPPNDPEYLDLLDRQEELRIWLTAHVPGPKLKFPAGLKVASGPEWWAHTHRGFPSFLEFEGYRRDGLKPIRALAAALVKAFAIVPTRWLVVRFVTVEQLAELFNQSAIAGLDRLTIQLHASEEPRDEIGRLLSDSRHLKNLRGLALGFSLGSVGVEALAQSEVFLGIERLTLEPTMLTPGAVRALAGSKWFRGLSELSLGGNCPADVFQELCEQRPFPKLHSLDLSDCDFPDAAWQAFARSKTFPALAELNIARTDLSGSRFASVAAAKWLRLNALDLSACAIGNSGVAELANAPWNEYLTRLNLRSNGFGPVGAAAIARCPRFTRLKHLNLFSNSLGVRTLMALAANPALRGITDLDLSQHWVLGRNTKPADYERFLRDLDMPNLRRLALSGSPLGPKAARLLTSGKFCSLTRLDLGGCRLTDAVVADLLAVPSLQNLVELDLSANSLRTGVASLTNPQTLPRLSVCELVGNRLSPDLIRKLLRCPGISK